MKKVLIFILIALSLLASACSAGSKAPSSPPPGTAYPSSAPSYNPGYSYAPSAAEAPGSTGNYRPAYPGESYLVIDENLATLTENESTLTFSLKVDTAAYTNVARYIQSGNLPPRDAVRTEELINYFKYDGYMEFSDDTPFALSAEVGPSPFSSNRYMAFIRVKTTDIDRSDLPASNITFLIDTSGSMGSYDKLPLLKESLGLLVETLTEDDRVSIVTYAGDSSILLDGVSGADKNRILTAINRLGAGGSTAGGKGIQTAYSLAEKNFLPNANNRVILATDGDFNVGISSTKELAKLVGEKRGNGIYLSILGFGMGNIRDDIMETLSKEGNGNYFYIKDMSAAKKALVDELASNLYTIADDVKAQIEFNPLNVKSYRLIGYENRLLDNEDFDDDTKDAGEIGAGTDVVMMFELELNRSSNSGGSRYTPAPTEQPEFSDELFFIRIRYKNPGEFESNLITQPVFFDDIVKTGSTDFRFACSVAAFGHLLRGSEYTKDVTIDDVLTLAEKGLGKDSAGYRIEYISLLQQYKRLAR